MKAGDLIAISLRAALAPIEDVSAKVVVARLVRIKGDTMWWSMHETWMRDSRNKLRVVDRGITWAPAWRENEVAALRTFVALGTPS